MSHDGYIGACCVSRQNGHSFKKTKKKKFSIFSSRLLLSSRKHMKFFMIYNILKDK
jgi:hypothetical protein